MQKRTRGFTLVELLIVMAIIAILAVGVLVGLNPVEQIKRSRDTAASEIVGNALRALIRYQTAYTKFPWTAANVTDPGTLMYRYDHASSGFSSVTDVVFSSGELKTGMYNQLTSTANSQSLTTLYVGGISVGAVNKLAACYVPFSIQSRNFLAAGAASFQGLKMYYAAANVPDNTNGRAVAPGVAANCSGSTTNWNVTTAPLCMICLIEE